MTTSATLQRCSNARKESPLPSTGRRKNEKNFRKKKSARETPSVSSCARFSIFSDINESRHFPSVLFNKFVPHRRRTDPQLPFAVQCTVYRILFQRFRMRRRTDYFVFFAFEMAISARFYHIIIFPLFSRFPAPCFPAPCFPAPWRALRAARKVFYTHTNRLFPVP